MNSKTYTAARWLLCAAFFGLLFYFPLVRVLWRGLTGSLFQDIFNSRESKIIWFTVWQASLSSTISVFLGIPGAYIFYKCSFKGQRILRTLITVPFMLPSIVVAIGFTNFHRFSADALIVAANVFMNYGLAVRVIGGTWTSLDREIEEAAGLDGARKLTIFTHIQLPALKNSISSAFALIFLYCAANFGIVLVLGNASTNTIETEIYANATQYLDLSKATSLVLAQTLLTIIVFSIIQRINSATFSIFGFNSQGLRKPLSFTDLPAILITLIPIALILTPVSTVIAKSFSSGLNNYRRLSGTGFQNFLSLSILHAALNSLRNGLLTALISLVIGGICAYSLYKNSGRSTRLIEILVQIPLGVSSVVIGLGYLLCFTSGIFPLRSSWLITAIAESLLATPLVIRLIFPALNSINSELTEAAAIDGASDSDMWWFIELPSISKIVLIALGYAAMISIGDFGAANFLAYGDQGTLTTELYQLISKPGAANYGMAMATSSILIVITALVLLTISD